MQILSLATSWCQNNKKENILNLSIIMPHNIKQTPLQVELREEEEELIILLESEREDNSS